MKGLWLLSTTLGKATGSEIYFNYVRQRYIKVSEDHFARRLNVSQTFLEACQVKNRQVRSKSSELFPNHKETKQSFPFNCFLFCRNGSWIKMGEDHEDFLSTVITLLLVANTVEKRLQQLRPVQQLTFIHSSSAASG